jgi:hypothetical protein
MSISTTLQESQRKKAMDEPTAKRQKTSDNDEDPPMTPIPSGRPSDGEFVTLIVGKKEKKFLASGAALICIVGFLQGRTEEGVVGGQDVICQSTG